MKRLTDEELIDDLRERFAFNQAALNDLREMTRKLEEVNTRLQESESLKGHFLSNIRNEINNPLTSIMGLSSQCMHGATDPERFASVARMIYEEAFHLDFQLQNIFVAAELEAGEAEPAYARVDVQTIVDRVVEAVDYQINEKCLKMVVQAAANLAFPTDARLLRLVLINLLANAVEFSPEAGEVQLIAKLVNDQLQLAVVDQGGGIDPADHDAVFDRFRQLDIGTTKVHRGHGLGLSIVKSLVELMGGELTLDSKLGAGCRFTLTLPQPDELVQDVAQEGNLFFFDDAEQF